MLERRKFLKQVAMGSAAFMIPAPTLYDFIPNGRKFKLSLNPSAIGVQLSQIEMLEKAAILGFEAIVPLIAEVSTMSDGQIDLISGKMDEYGLTWDAAGLPVEFRKDEVEFREGLFRLPEACAGLRNAGANKMSTWIMPMHSELTYRKNFDLHVRRIKLMASMLKEYDIKLGLEYVGPRTLMLSQKFPFIRTLTETLELISEINEPNVGIQLDSFHWYCAGETETDIRQLDKDMIVTCDLNDAIMGRAPDDQIDWERQLPGDSGVIDIKAFLGALLAINYDGAIRAEPFNSTLNEMDDQLALDRTYESMKKAVDLL